MTASVKIRKSIILLSFVFLILASLLGLLYLRDVNSLATKGYEIKEKEEKLEELKTESQRLKIELVEVSRLEKLNEFAESKDLIKIEKASFLSAPGELVVTKR